MNIIPDIVFLFQCCYGSRPEEVFLAFTTEQKEYKGKIVTKGFDFVFEFDEESNGESTISFNDFNAFKTQVGKFFIVRWEFRKNHE